MYALTVFLGAFLLFQVQPITGKYLLPWFGGGPGVWATCLFFFQIVLLAGYAYAHLLTNYFRPRNQCVVHLLLTAAAFSFLPIIPSPSWKPTGDEQPWLRIILLLAATLGVPCLLLASTSPLIQRWYSQLRPSGSAYRLYALSNVGSMLALLSYPLWFEAHLSRSFQATLWGWSLAGYGICGGWCAFRMWGIGRATGLKTAVIDHDADPQQWWIYSSTWILLTRNQSFLELPSISTAAKSALSHPKVVRWTDDFSSLSQILR